MALKLKKQKRGDEPRTPLTPGEVLTTDIIKDPATCFAERWVLGTCIGNGTFGELYLAIPDGSDASRDAVVAKHVVKVLIFKCAINDAIIICKRTRLRVLLRVIFLLPRN